MKISHLLLATAGLIAPATAATVTFGITNANAPNGEFRTELANIQGTDVNGVPRSATLLLPKFDDMMGQRILTGVTISATGDISGNITAENLETDGPIEATGTAAGSLRVILDGDENGQLTTADNRRALIALQSEFTSTIELAPSGFGEPAGTAQPNGGPDTPGSPSDFFDFGNLITGGGMGTITVSNTPASFARFISAPGDDSIAIFLTGTSAFSVTFDGGDGTSATRELEGFATPTITYEFTEAVPEPSSALLLALFGISSLTLTRRR